jgi:hypothetical protein
MRKSSTFSILVADGGEGPATRLLVIESDLTEGPSNHEGLQGEVGRELQATGM